MNMGCPAIRLSDRVYWVGAIDWNVRDFHGYTTKRGSTYNAFLVLAEQPTLIDTVKAPFRGEMMARIASVMDPEKIEVIVSNHSEMDHSGCLSETIRDVRPGRVYASAVGAKTLSEIYHFDREITPVKDGETVSLGDLHLTFMETRMLHWPDSMFAYLAEEQILFSQDAFGMHLATQERFDDEIDPAILNYEAATYYANILLPYSELVTRLLKKVAASGLVFKMIAPDHGPVWRSDREGIIGRYARWAEQTPANKAVVTYGTMWHSTELLACALAEGLAAGGCRVKVMPLEAFHRSDVVYEVLDAGILLVGSSTLNNQLLPQVADILTYVKGLKPKNLSGFAFGSYGWSGEATRQIEDVLRDMKVDLLCEPFRIRNVPDGETLGKAHALGREAAEKLRRRLADGARIG